MIYTKKNEVELKKVLDADGFRYGGLNNSDEYIIAFYDNKSGAIVSRGVYGSPVSALRTLNELVQTVKLPLQDFTILLEVAYSPVSKKCKYFEDIELSPYLYFDEKKDSENK